MQKLRQVIRLYGQGKGSKSINSMLGVSRNTVKKYFHIFHTSGLSYDQFFSISDIELSLLFQVNKSLVPSHRQLSLESLLPQLCKELKRKGVTRKQLHRQYLEKYPDSYCRSRFNNFVHLYLGQSHPVMRIDHKAGEKMYIDFAGSRFAVEVFVAILGCSQLTYVEAVFSQKKEDLIKVCGNALHYFEGVPQVIVPDNLKSAVTKSSKYEAIINSVFACFAEHYSSTVIPARAYKPRDKSLVEGAVKLVYKNIYTKLDGRVFHDLDSLNTAIRVGL